MYTDDKSCFSSIKDTVTASVHAQNVYLILTRSMHLFNKKSCNICLILPLFYSNYFRHNKA